MPGFSERLGSFAMPPYQHKFAPAIADMGRRFVLPGQSEVDVTCGRVQGV
jgi:hypothetical protein